MPQEIDDAQDGREQAMTDIKNAIEKARFTVLQGTPFEAYMIKGKQVVNANQRTPFDLMFGIKDVVADKVMIGLKPAPKMCPWARKIPMEVIEYCYKMVGYSKSSFVWDVSDQGGKYDYFVLVLDNDKVQRTRDYEIVFNS